MVPVVGKGLSEGWLSSDEVEALVAEALGKETLQGKSVLVIIPDGTRTFPVSFFFRHVCKQLLGRVEHLSFMVALGTHRPLTEDELIAHVGISPTERVAAFSEVGIHNHRWDLPGVLQPIGSLTEAEVKRVTQGLLEREVSVVINRMVLDCDQIILCGPTYPHEVAGYSGGNKYLFPGVSGGEIVDWMHWVAALVTTRQIIGTLENPVRALIDRAAAILEKPALSINVVMGRQGIAGLYAGPPEEAFAHAAWLSMSHNVQYCGRRFERVLSMPSHIYKDLWTAAKAMYKVDPVVADGGEVVIYAPQITSLSDTHGEVIEQVGYHVAGYFRQQWSRFSRIRPLVLAHSAHLKGSGSYEGGLEYPRIEVSLATGIPEEACRRVNLGYRDPASIQVGKWANQEDNGLLLVRDAGEVLYQLRAQGLPGQIR